jgi:hypothetical protein
MNQENMQNEIDRTYILCDKLKDELAILNAKHKESLEYLFELCDTTNLQVSQSVCDKLMGRI